MDENRPRRSAHAFLSVSALCFLAGILVIGTFGPGCRDENQLPVDRNMSPETFLTGAPGDSQTSFYAVRLYWSGMDEDGEVVGFEYAVTESLPDLESLEYEYTTRTDSLFRFQVEPTREVLGHRFYVRAVDNDGRRDPVPAWTFFGARNTCPPEVIFTQAIGYSPDLADTIHITSTTNRERSISDTIPAGWSVCFEWEGFDCDAVIEPDGSVRQVGSIQAYFRNLAPREFSELGGTINDTTICYSAEELQSNPYFFRVRAVDDAGYSGAEPALRSFVWNRDPITHFEKIFDPERGDSVEVIYADTVGGLDPVDFVPIQSGDTVALPRGGVKFRTSLTAFDPDDPTGVGSVVSYEARVVELSARYADLPVEDPSYGDGLSLQSSQSFTIQGRSTDRLDRPGRPSTFILHVNRPPVWVTEGTYFGRDFVQVPQPGDVIEVAPGAETIDISFFAFDPDTPLPPNNFMEYRYRFDRIPGQTSSESFGPWVQGAPLSQGFLDLALGLQNGGAFVPGEYILTLDAQEHRIAAFQSLVRRRVRRSVTFTVVES